MLLAELRHKVNRPFACPDCGAETAPEAAVGIEDALTSYVFGALRHLPARWGVLPLLRRAKVVIAQDEDFEVEPWPYGVATPIKLGEREPTQLGVEPDVQISNNRLLVGVETKLGMRLGTDPIQLPKEVLWLRSQAKGADWLLLCITADWTEPKIQSFTSSGGSLGLADALLVADAVASYFEAARIIAPGHDWPDAEHVRSRVRWMSWGDAGLALSALLEGGGSAESWAERALRDLIELLSVKGLSRERFHGFALELRRLPQGVEPIWREARAPVSLWNALARDFASDAPLAWLSKRAVLWAQLRGASLGTGIREWLSSSDSLM